MRSTALVGVGIAKWPAPLAIVVFVVAARYYATPNVKQSSFADSS